MKTQLLIGVIATVTGIGGAVYQGFLCDRWGARPTEELNMFAQRLEGVPTQIGPWTLAEEVPVDQEQFKESMCNGVVSRRYQNTVTGQDVNVFLVSGKAYHVTIHTPDWCYVSAGYEMQKNPANYTVKCPRTNEEPDFLTALFYKETATETSRLRILWSYTDDGRWTAPKLAKQLFARKPALYKVYLIHAIQDSPPDLPEDPAVEFAKEFIPAVNNVLFPPESAAPVGADSANAGEPVALR